MSENANPIGDFVSVVKNDAYVHVTTAAGLNITFARNPNNPRQLFAVETRAVRKKLIGKCDELKAASLDNPLHAYLEGTKEEMSIFFNEKKLQKKMLPSWAERTINDHLRYFY